MIKKAILIAIISSGFSIVNSPEADANPSMKAHRKCLKKIASVCGQRFSKEELKKRSRKIACLKLASGKVGGGCQKRLKSLLTKITSKENKNRKIVAGNSRPVKQLAANSDNFKGPYSMAWILKREKDSGPSLKKLLVIFLIYFLIAVFLEWRLSYSLGNSGLAFFLPFFNMLSVLRALGKSGWWTFFVLLAGVCFFLCWYLFALNPFLCSVGMLASFFWGVGYWLRYNRALARHFGRPAGFGLALALPVVGLICRSDLIRKD